MQASDVSHELMLSDMIRGFDSLLEHVDALRARNAELQEQLDAIHKKNLATPAATEDGKPRSRSHSRVQEEVECSYNTVPVETRAVRKAREISTSWRDKRKPRPQKIALPSIELPEGHPQVDEQDFTTPGATPGRLGCPFTAMMAEKNRAAADLCWPEKPPTPASAEKEDPIAAEFHSTGVSSPPPSASGSAAKCPIRFLDQHKPEEIAQYFENHKHEIPRSHEICIKRYQTNEQSIRELDAKYGNLVNMIQGLGMKHKPWLPHEHQEEGIHAADGDSQVLSDKDAAKIEQWAGAVTSDPTTEPPLTDQLHNETVSEHAAEGQRTPRFERDLREVRLGESPSRPWGIQVPLNVEEEDEHLVSDSAHIAASVNKKPSISSRRPVPPSLHGITSGTNERVKPTIGSGDGTSRSMVFNGPVFFGYSADDMARLLQQIPELRRSSGI